MSLPLEGLKVLDLSRILAGPYCTMMLADLGADVVKVERPGTGDDTRSWGPPFAGNQSAYFLSLNRNKRSIAVDLKHPEGAALITELASSSDVLVHNFPPKVVARLGLTYEPLAAANPRLVYCTLSSFGLDGPYAHHKGYDALIQGMGGLMSITGAADGPPTKVGVAIVDVHTALFAQTGILAALLQAERTGRGQHVDVALLDSLVASLVNQAQNYLVTGVPPGRMGSAHPNIVPYQPFEAADGWFMVAVGNDGQFRSLCGLLDLPELAERYPTNRQRVAARELIVPRLAERLRTRLAAEWVEACLAAGVPAGPIHDLAGVFSDEHVVARGIVAEVAHPEAGSVRLVSNPLRFGGARVPIRRPPPLLGEHTDEVLRELGRSDEQIGALRTSGAVG